MPVGRRRVSGIILRLAASSCLSLATTAHAQAPAAPAADRDSSVSLMRGLVERYATDRAAVERSDDLSVSDARRERLREYFEAQLRLLEGQKFDALDQAGRVDYLLLRNEIRSGLKQLEHERKRFEEVAALVPFSKEIVELEQARRRMEPIDSARSAKILTEISARLATTRKELEQAMKSAAEPSGSAPSAVVADRAARTADALRRNLKRWHDFHAGYDPEFTWWMRQPYAKVDKEIQDYAAFLRKRVAGYEDGEDGPVIGDPIGRAALLDALAAEMIVYTPEELIEIANREFAWCEAEMKRAANDLGFDGDWAKALDHVSKTHVKPGDQPKLIKELADEATKFVEDRNLVTVPELCKRIWRMEMMSVERQKVNPYFTGGEVISVSYPTDAMSHEDKLMSMRGNNPAFSRATVHHELIPGHHLQLFMAERYNTHRRPFRTPFLVEGWALYWEMLLWDLGFPRTAEERVGMLFWRAHRCARIIFSLKFHLGQMTAPEAIDFLVERVGHERRNATAEVRRSVAGNYGPLYQAAYMLGGLQIRAMRTELVESGKMTDRQFHDGILRQNAIPIEMIRASLGGHTLRPDFEPSWRFYGEPNREAERK